MASAHFSLDRLGLGPLANIASYHLLLYGTLLGTELYQVFLPNNEIPTERAQLTAT